MKQDIKLRGVINGDLLTLSAPANALIHRGTDLAHVADRLDEQIAIADLVLSDEEVFVEFLAGDRPEARQAIIDWCGLVGHSRAWFADGFVVPLEEQQRGPASTCCPTCGWRSTENEANFWPRVEKQGFFRLNCDLCGSTIPQRSESSVASNPESVR